MSSVIENITAAIHDTISKNFLPLFKRQQPKQVSKAFQKLTTVTSDRFLFSRLNIGGQQRDGDLDEFFMHENESYLPSLSEFGNLRSTKESDLIECMTKGIAQTSPPESYEAKVLDAAALVHALPVSPVLTFDEYSRVTFIPFVTGKLSNTSRMDIVWDAYQPESLKEATCQRGTGVRKKLAGHVKMPRNWKPFLGVAETRIVPVPHTSGLLILLPCRQERSNHTR